MSLNHTRNADVPPLPEVPQAGWHDAELVSAVELQPNGVEVSFTFNAPPSRRPSPGLARDWSLTRSFHLPEETDGFDHLLLALDVETVVDASDLVGRSCRIRTVTRAGHTSAAIVQFG